jgi:hypothetical protein
VAEVLIVAAIAAASAAATYTVNYALSPKPKPVERGRLQGQVQVQDSSYGSMIPIIVGGEMPDGSAHGMRVAGNVIYMTDIRKHENTTSGTGGGGGGGKGGGGGGQSATKTITYDADIGIMFGEGELELLALYAGTDLIFDNRVTSRTGIIDTTILPDDPYDYRHPPNPYDTALLQSQDLRYGAAPVTNGTTGTTSAQVVAGAYSQLRFYAGTETQLVDPVIEADWGVNQTPAYLGRSYVMLEKFDLSRYNAVPNFTAVLRNKNLKTVAQITTHFASRSGYNTATEFDASALTQNVRGLAIVNRTSLQKLSSDTLAKVFPFDWTQRAGKLTAVSRGGAVIWAVPDKHLGFTAGGNETSSGDNSVPPPKVATKLELSETKLPRVIDVKAFDPNKDFEVGLSSYHREVVESQLHRTEELNIVLTEDERRAVAQRLMEQAWLEEREISSFTVSHAYAAAVPTDVAQVTVVKDGVTTINTLRIKEITGSIPGPLTITGVPTRSALYIASGGTTPPATPKPVAIPGTVIGGFIDAGFLRDRDAYAGQLGVYLYATGVGNGDYKTAWAYRNRGAGFERMVELPEQAIAGRCVTTLDGSSTLLTVDLYRNAELDTYSSGEVSTGSGFIFAGNECLQYTTATPVVGFANRWTLTGLTNRGAKETSGNIASHAANERFVLLNTALRFIPLDLAEKGVAEDWKFVSLGMAVDDAAPVSFTWLGAPPPTPTGLSLEQINESATSATIRGTFAFGSYSSSEQIGRVLIKRDGDTVFRDSGKYPTPDTSNNGTFEIAGVTPGTHSVKVQSEFKELHSAPTAPVDIPTTTSGAITLKDSGLIIQDDAVPTKQIRFDVSGISAGTTRTFSMPDASDTIVGATTSQTLTNKTLTGATITAPTGLTKSDVGLGNVDNTSDANKPVSTAQAAAIALKLSIANDLSDLHSVSAARTNLGLGTGDSPTFAALTLSGPTPELSLTIATPGNRGKVTFRNSGGSAIGDVSLQDGTGNMYLSPYAAADAVTILNTSGNVGIGTTSPVSKLDVRGGITLATTDYVAGSAGSIIQLQPVAGTGSVNSGLQAYKAGATAFADILLNAAGGNVGIGTVSPGYKLETAGAVASVQPTTTRYAELGLQLQTSSAAASNTTHKPSPVAQWQGSIWNGSAATNKIIEAQLMGVSGTNSAYYLEIASSDVANILNIRGDTGNVGIGTTSPTLRLHVAGNSTPDADPVALAVSDPTNGNERITLGYDITNHWGTIQAINTGVAVKPLLLNPRGGSVGVGYATAGSAALAVNGPTGIGTTSPTGLLDVNDDHIRIRTAKTPASSGAAGNAGDKCWDDNFEYTCVATNTWKRVAIATW